VPPKIYTPSPDVIQRLGVHSIDKDLYFVQRQAAILGLMNTDYGRDLYCLPSKTKMPYRIDWVAKHAVHFDVSKDAGPGVGQFWLYVGAKYANITRYRMEDIIPALKKMDTLLQEPCLEEMLVWKRLDPRREIVRVGRGYRGLYRMDNGVLIPEIAGGVDMGNIYPDTGTGGTTMDSMMTKGGTDDTWAFFRDAATGTPDETNVVFTCGEIRSDGPANTYRNWARAIATYDTTPIPDTDDISDADINLYGRTLTDNYDLSLTICIASPASDNDLVDADWVQTGTVEQATRFDYTNVSLTAYNVIAFTQTGRDSINKATNSRYGFRASRDLDDAEPTHQADITGTFTAWAVDDTGTSRDEYMTATHAAPFVPRTMIIG